MISDIHGVFGRAMLAAVIAGERSPLVLAEMARGAWGHPPPFSPLRE